MPQRAHNIDYMGIEFASSEQRKRFEVLVDRPILPTRYSDDLCLRTLGLDDSVHWMFDRIGWNHFLTLRHRTYERLTLEFLSSLDYKYLRLTHRGWGGTMFRMFNRDYLFNQDYIGTLLHFHTGDNIAYEVPSGEPWTSEFPLVWQRLTGDLATGTSGNKSSRIHNPAIRYFQKVLAHTIFGRGESTGNVNSKELFFIDSVFQARRIHTAAFMLANMQATAKAAKGAIVIGGLITSLALALGLESKLANLVPLEDGTPLNLHSCLHQNFVEVKGQTQFYLMIRNELVRSIVLPNKERIDVRNENNWLFDLEAPEAPPAAHPAAAYRADDAHEGGDTDDEYDRQERLSPAHSYPHLTPSPDRHIPPHTQAPDYPPPPPPYMHAGFPGGTSYTSQSSVEYELNALRHEVADLRAAQQERNDQEVERDHQMRVNSHMIRQMFTWMTRHGMPPADSDDDV